jgi:3'(2'), 5'-bisphosphate nucleotidase
MDEKPIVGASLVDEICEFAVEAGRRIMPYYRAAIKVTSKEDKSPLTDADLASHDYLTGVLRHAPVISEESEPSSLPVGRYWLVDPLDGTKEFLKGTNEFTVNIALIENNYPVLGVVHAPALDLTYCAAVCLGAWRRPGAKIAVRPPDLANLAIVASKDHAGPLVQRLLARHPTASLRSMGSSLKFCLVAEGAADIYLRDIPTMEWDTAAAQCIVEAAGGRICALDGTRLRYGKEGLRNPALLTVGDASLERIVLQSI